MYRWLLCWRYLRTRYIALASVVSVTLGVATLIIVNSVMDGFTTEMQERMHGILSDVVIESHSANGLPNLPVFESQIRETLGDDLLGMTKVVHVPAMVSIDHLGESITRQITLIGIDVDTYAQVSDFSEYLLHPENQRRIGFDLRDGGYAPDRDGFPLSGWEYRRQNARAFKRLQEQIRLEQERNAFLKQKIDEAVQSQDLGTELAAETQTDNELKNHSFSFPPPQPEATAANDGDAIANVPTNGQSGSGGAGPSFDSVVSREEDHAQVFDPEFQQWDGIVLGISIGSTRVRDSLGNPVDYYYTQPGDDVTVTFPSAGNTPTAINQHFTVVDFYESKMSEYDATFAFVPMATLQKARGMQDAVSSIQLKLRDGADLDSARDALQGIFTPHMGIQVSTWRDLQGALLAAVQMETTILNILLFLIIAVAGFGILATFFMIVVEKTKDIGILKSLGASGTGVASIFLGYGVLLGTFGAGVGAIAGLVFVAYINNIADLLESVTGQEVFDPTVYYFDTIPTIVHPSTVVWVIIGAVCIAVLASVLPSIRAARMHPVEALRYE